MLRSLVALEPPVLPMDSQEKLLRAIKLVLREGGPGGRPRAEGAIDDFKRAVRHWHARLRLPAVENDLSSPWASLVFDGVRRMAPPPLPKNARFMADAEHGHLALPLDILLQAVSFCEGQLRDSNGSRWGLHRDLTIMVLLFFMTRRFDEVWQLSAAALTDLGPSVGFNWAIAKMKNKQRTSSIVPIPETTRAGVAVGARLRAFLAIGPAEGRLFRATANQWGSTQRGWEPARFVKTTFDEYMVPRVVTLEAGLSSGSWNEAFQRVLQLAAPGVNPRLYTAHSLRVGGVKAGADAELTIEQLARCCEHRDRDSTMGYMRDSLTERRSHFAAIGSGPSL